MAGRLLIKLITDTPLVITYILKQYSFKLKYFI